MNLRLKSNFDTSLGQTMAFRGKKLTYSTSDFEKITQNIDDILGKDKFFSARLKAAQIKPKNGIITIEDEGFLKVLLKTIKYPIFDMPLDIANSFFRFLEKTPLKSLGQGLSEKSVFKNRALKAEKEKSTKVIQEILGQYFNNGEGIDKQSKEFRKKITSNISKTVKNYNTRDERTGNRAFTSTVSAVYSAADFFNISMLQNDDKEQAKKAQKARFKQEMFRMGLSASLTFITLGALDKYVKTNIVLNSLVIALSALISEVGSRLLSHTPLHPLSPKEAEKIALKKKEKNNYNNETEGNAKKDVNFKGKNREEIFKQFNNNIIPRTSKVKEKTKTHSSILKKLAIAMGVSSSIYFLSKGIKGEFGVKLARKRVINNNKQEILNFINNKTKLSNSTKRLLCNINEINNSSKIEKLITKKKEKIELYELLQNLKYLKNTEEGSCVSNLIDEYISHIEGLMYNYKGRGVITASVDRFLLPGVYNGVTKIFKTVYQILSLPAAGLNGLINKLVFKNSDNTYKKAMKLLDNANIEKVNSGYEREIADLAMLFKKYKKLPNRDEKIVKQIKNATRNFETSAETGELANLSRTMVTAISTYFFVNDYTNKVLIESKGKDIDEAKEERNERIAHKLSNFVINGTLMNLFNSIFKTPLNDSLPKALVIASATEATNEFLVRKSICQPVMRKGSRKEIIDYEEKQVNKKGLMGAWSRLFRKITNKKTLVQRAGIDKDKK